MATRVRPKKYGLGTPLNTSNLTAKHFKPPLKPAGLPKTIRLYDLRHTCATLLLSAGENPKVVSERLGHASITLTLDVYSHVLPDRQKAATDKLRKHPFQTHWHTIGTQDRNGQLHRCP